MSHLTQPHPFLPEPLFAALAASTGAAAGECYVVGGYVRDRLGGRPAADLDVAVAGDPRLVAVGVGRRFGGSVFPLSEEHGAWRVSLRERVSGVGSVDVTSLRGSIAADLALRDFTINAMAGTLDGETLIDPHGGAEDLRAGVIRSVSDTAIDADPIRALRAVRLAVELDLTVEPHTAALIRRDAALLARVAGERAHDELMRVLDTDRGMSGVRLMDDLDLLDVILPELIPAKGCSQPKEHYWEVFDHCVETVGVLDCLLARQVADEACRQRAAVLWEQWQPADGLRGRYDGDAGSGHSRRALLKLTGLLHDVSKPETKAVQADGRTRFFGHDERGAVVASEALRRLRFSGREVGAVEALIRDHLRPGQLAAPGEVPTARALYRFYRDLGELVPDLLLLNLADGAAAAGPRQTAAQWLGHVRYTAWILAQGVERESLTRPPRLVTGHDLIGELGLAPGPALGRILAELAEAEAAGELRTRDEALSRARALVAAEP